MFQIQLRYYILHSRRRNKCIIKDQARAVDQENIAFWSIFELMYLSWSPEWMPPVGVAWSAGWGKFPWQGRGTRAAHPPRAAAPGAPPATWPARWWGSGTAQRAGAGAHRGTPRHGPRPRGPRTQTPRNKKGHITCRKADRSTIIIEVVWKSKLNRVTKPVMNTYIM